MGYVHVRPICIAAERCSREGRLRIRDGSVSGIPGDAEEILSRSERDGTHGFNVSLLITKHT